MALSFEIYTNNIPALVNDQGCIFFLFFPKFYKYFYIKHKRFYFKHICNKTLTAHMTYLWGFRWQCS